MLKNQDGSVLLFAQEVAPLFGGKANQIGNPLKLKKQVLRNIILLSKS